MKSIFHSALVAIALGCATSDPSTGASISGTLRLVRPDVVSGLPAPAAGYGDRRYRGAIPVDYTRPGFAVVYLGGGPVPEDSVELRIRESAAGVRVTPTEGAAGLRGAIRVQNHSSRAQVVTCPEAGWLARVEPGASTVFRPHSEGAHTIALLGGGAESASVFVSPGRFAVVSGRGHWEIGDVAPGRWNLHTWHPRFPSTRRSVTVREGRTSRVELPVGIHLDDGDTQ